MEGYGMVWYLNSIRWDPMGLGFLAAALYPLFPRLSFSDSTAPRLWPSTPMLMVWRRTALRIFPPTKIRSFGILKARGDNPHEIGVLERAPWTHPVPPNA